MAFITFSLVVRLHAFFKKQP